MTVTPTDRDELASFGYKQELDRSLGRFSSFAAGFSYLSILTGIFQLFGLGFLFGGPAFWWSFPIVFVGQFLVALCFAELAGQYPLAGSVYQWSKQIARPLTSGGGGWLLLGGPTCPRGGGGGPLRGFPPPGQDVPQFRGQPPRRGPHPHAG